MTWIEDKKNTCFTITMTCATYQQYVETVY